MGCDIHFYVERRTDAGWEQVTDHSDNWSDPLNWYGDRNYDLFAILADVRNGYGFAGAKTGDGFTPIAAPRGLPSDVSDAVRAESEEWGPDGHSHSHLTVAEILSFDWDQIVVKTTLVKDVNDRFPNGGQAARAQEYADHRMDFPDWIHDTCSEVAGTPEHVAQYKRVTWRTPYSRRTSTAWWATVARASRLSKGALDDVRFVFWFDN